MGKKTRIILSLIFAILISSSFCLAVCADEYSEITEITEMASGPYFETDPVSEPVTEPSTIADNTEPNMGEEYSENSEIIIPDTSSVTEPSLIAGYEPALEDEEYGEIIREIENDVTTTEAPVTRPEGKISIPYSTIKFTGMTYSYVITIQNTETKEKFKLEFNKSNNWTVNFEGPEGTYNIKKITSKSNYGKISKVYDAQRKEIKAFKIQRTDGFQFLELLATEKGGIDGLHLLKQNSFFLIALAVIGPAYLVIRKKGSNSLRAGG